MQNQRLDIYVAEREGISRSAAARLIENGYVTVNGAQQSKNYRLREDDEVNIEETEPEPAAAEAQDIPLDVIYEDDMLILVNKPKGMVVHPAAGNLSGTLVNALLHHCGNSLSGIGGVIRPGIVHRLDRDTSGLLIAAKNDAAHIFISEQLKSRKMGRIYEAVIQGRLKEPEGTVNAPIGRHPADRKKMAVISEGREAVTHYRVICEYDTPDGFFTHISLRLETGRTHQIRVHMAHIGHPVLGDAVYGNGKNRFEKNNEKILCGQCLHARTIEFIHPVTRELMRFDSGLPAYFSEIIKKLEHISGK